MKAPPLPKYQLGEYISFNRDEDTSLQCDEGDQVGRINSIRIESDEKDQEWAVVYYLDQHDDYVAERFVNGPVVIGAKR